MATLVVFKFPTAEGAQTMLSTLASLQKQQLIQIEDGAILTWPAGAKKPKTKQLSDMTGAGALGGAFWGMLFGLLFFIPFLGLAIGAAMGALMGTLLIMGSTRISLTRCVPRSRQALRRCSCWRVVRWSIELLRRSRVSSSRSFRPTCPKSKKTSSARILASKARTTLVARAEARCSFFHHQRLSLHRPLWMPMKEC